MVRWSRVQTPYNWCSPSRAGSKGCVCGTAIPDRDRTGASHVVRSGCGSRTEPLGGIIQTNHHRGRGITGTQERGKHRCLLRYGPNRRVLAVPGEPSRRLTAGTKPLIQTVIKGGLIHVGKNHNPPIAEIMRRSPVRLRRTVREQVVRVVVVVERQTNLLQVVLAS